MAELTSHPDWIAGLLVHLRAKTTLTTYLGAANAISASTDKWTEGQKAVLLRPAASFVDDDEELEIARSGLDVWCLGKDPRIAMEVWRYTNPVLAPSVRRRTVFTGANTRFYWVARRGSPTPRNDNPNWPAVLCSYEVAWHEEGIA
jgi:hypothetical protein